MTSPIRAASVALMAAAFAGLGGAPIDERGGPILIYRGRQPRHIAVPNPKAEKRKAAKVAAMQARKRARKGQP